MKRFRSNSRAKHLPLPAYPWVSWVLFGSFVLLLTAWFGGRPAMRWGRCRQVGEFLSAARTEMENEEWGEAARWIRNAFQTAPDDPAVIRAMAEFQSRIHSHPSDVVQTLLRLSNTAAATPDDLAALARAQIELGSHAAARKTLSLLPEAVRSTHVQAAEAEAYLLKLERRHDAADALLRAALAVGNGDAQTPLKMAILDLKQPQSHIHQRGRSSLWSLAQRGASMLRTRLASLPQILPSPQASLGASWRS